MYEEDGPTFFELIEQALQSTERGYDLIARKFDKTPFRTPPPICEVLGERIGHVGAMLDVCCGTGAMMLPMLGRCDRLVGIDFSQGMLDEAKRRIEGAAIEGKRAAVEYVRGDVLDMPFTGAFDAATSVGAFGHILEEDEPRFVRSIARALRPGGRFIFATAELPPTFSRAFLVSKGFNAVMRVRNALIQPQFVMYYLTFLWPRVRETLHGAGFEVTMERGAFPAPFERLLLVTATTRS